MYTRKFHLVALSWEGPFAVDYDRAADTYSWESLVAVENLAEHGGLYQIYGRHPTYGLNALLYIGCVRPNSSKRGIGMRLAEHVKTRFMWHTNLAAHLAPLEANVLTDGITVELVESILIYAHQPALNRQNIDEARWDKKSVLVRNWGFVGSLQDCCTNDWQ